LLVFWAVMEVVAMALEKDLAVVRALV